MGQSYLIADLDKREFIYPHAFNDGYKLLEFGCGLTMTALAVLLADGNGRGGGDLVAIGPGGRKRVAAVAGRWKGDRIVVAGDYADPQPSGETIYDEATAHGSTWTDISLDVIEALATHRRIRAKLVEKIKTANDEWSLPRAYFARFPGAVERLDKIVVDAARTCLDGEEL